MSAELIDAVDRGRLAEALLADIIALPGEQDITTTQDVRFVMKGGRVYKRADRASPSDSKRRPA